MDHISFVKMLLDVLDHKVWGNVIYAIGSLIIALCIWTSLFEWLGGAFGGLIGMAVVIVTNLLHFFKGYFYSNPLDTTNSGNAFYLDYVYVKIVAFLTVGPSWYGQKALIGYKEMKNNK